MKRVLITGINGQDGSYLAELLLDKGYEVNGTVRRVALEDPQHKLWRIDHLLSRVQLHVASLDSYASILDTVEKVRPDECYHLAAESFVNYSFDNDFSTINTNINGTHFVLSAIKAKAPACRFYFAATSEMFGNARESPQSEATQFWPRSPYGISKLAGYHITRNYREAYGLHACSGIMFNHESERRGFEYVTRKVSHAVASVKLGFRTELRLGNLEARRDWGFAPDYVRAMWLMLQQAEPDDYVIGTGETWSVRQLVDKAFGVADLNWEDHVVEDERFYRPAEECELRADPRRAMGILGWKPSISFDEMIQAMVEADLLRQSAKHREDRDKGQSFEAGG